MSKKTEGRIEFLKGFPDDVIAVEFTGYVDGEQFENVLKPEVAERINKEGKVKLFYVMGKGFDKVSSDFVWDDASFAVQHMRHVARIAIVTDKKWLRKSAHFFSRLVLPEVRVFRLKDKGAAKEWITENKPPEYAETEAETDARHRMEKAQKAILPIEQ